MKKIFTILALIIPTSNALTQCVANGITTNPAAPVNNQLPSKTNLYFDWTQTSWQNNSSCEPMTIIESPFYKIDNLEILRASKDMQPEDGWELLRREFGYTDQDNLKLQAPEHTYFLLYNKYTGILRVLLKACRTGTDYNGVKITIKFDATTNFQTALLDLTTNAKPLDRTHIPNPIGQSAGVFVNDKTKWFYADFPMAYDPCTCFYKAKLNIVSQLIQNSQISLGGALTGTITSITNGLGNVSDDGSYSFKDFVTGAEKFTKVYSSVDNFIKKTKDVAATLPNSGSTTSALTSFQSALKNSQFLKVGIASVPWLASAVSLLDFFTGGGKASPQLTQLMPMSVNLALKVDGTISTANQYHDIKFSNPGSLDAQYDPDIYPFYNEVLGVLNFINGPKGTRYIQNPDRMIPGVYQFKLTDPIKWTLNPASGLELQDGQVAFVADFSYPYGNPPQSAGQGFDYLEGQNVDNPYTWTFRTNYVDINCLSTNDFFSFQFPALGVGSPRGDIYLKFMFNLKRVNDPNAQNVLLILKVPIQWGAGVLSGTPFNPAVCNGGAISRATPAEVNTFCSSSIYTTNRFMKKAFSELIVHANEDFDITVTPNPTQSLLNLRGIILAGKIVKFQIIDMLGTVHYESAEQFTEDFSKKYPIGNITNGIYIIRVFSSTGKSKSLKVVIQK